WMWLVIIPGCALFEANVDRTVGHCDMREASLDPAPFCQEWRGLVRQPVFVTAEGVCATLGTDFVPDQVCDDTELVVGGCFMGKLGDGSGSFQWYYTSDEEPLTADQVRDQECDDPADFVAYFPYDDNASDWGPPEG
ncbi:MAG: hypothetical protein AB8H79_21860, partial [Myxococcota bacterium]